MKLCSVPAAFGIVVTVFSAIPVKATSEWWIVGFQQDFCEWSTKGDTWYNWRNQAGDSSCHNFATSDEGCVYTTNIDGSTGSAVACGPTTDDGRREQAYILSAFYEQGRDNDLSGCTFWSEANCQGDAQTFTSVEETNHCFEFRSQRVSFECL